MKTPHLPPLLVARQWAVRRTVADKGGGRWGAAEERQGRKIEGWRRAGRGNKAGCGQGAGRSVSVGGNGIDEGMYDAAMRVADGKRAEKVMN